MKTEVVIGHKVLTARAGLADSHLTHSLPANTHSVAGIDAFEDRLLRAKEKVGPQGARANPSFILHEANTPELAEAASAAAKLGGVEGTAVAAFLRGGASVCLIGRQASRTGARAWWRGNQTRP